MGTVDQSSAKDEDCSFLPWQPPLLPPLRPRPSPATATATATELATDAPTEDTVATLVATGPMEATMARGRLSLLLLLRLKPIPTMALTDTVDFPTEATDALSEATGVLTDSLLTVATDVPTEDMVATDVATTARERPRLPLRLRLMLTTDTVTDAATEVTGSLHTVATDASMEDMVATDVVTTERGRLMLPLRLRLRTDTATPTDAATEAMEATDALTVMATESRQQPEHPTPHKQPRIAQYELNKKQVLDLLYLDPLRII